MMKKLIHIAIFALVLIAVSHGTALAWETKSVAFGDMPTKGNWGEAGKTTNITGDGTINLTGNISVLGPIAINGNIVINNNTSGEITITWKGTCGSSDADEEKSMFRVRNGSSLKITAATGKRIYLDGGATWDTTNGKYLENAEAEASDAYMTVNHFKPASGCKQLPHGLIRTFGTLTLEYVNLRDTYNNTDDTNACGVTVENHVNNGKTTFTQCHFYRLVGKMSPAIYMRGNDNVNDEDATKVTMTGGSIRCCRSTQESGILRTNGKTDASLLMDGVWIFCNYSSTGGGGIHWNASGGKNGKTKLTLKGCTIERNIAANGRGGGLFAEASFEFTGSKTVIQKNRASGMGGGIYVNAYNGTTLTSAFDFVFSLNNLVEIKNNQSSDVGGGAAIDFDNGTIAKGSTVTININNTTVTGNTAGRHGGGLYVRYNPADPSVYKFTCKLGGSNISSNTAGLDGGGLWVQGASIGTTGSGTTTISGNKALDGRGGGLYLYNGDLTQGNLTVTNNSSANTSNREGISYYGGGIYQVNGSFTCSGAVTITGNSTSARGGGFYVNSGSVTFSSTSSVANISNNSAGGHGGGFYVNSGNVDIQSATINGNSTQLQGGGFAVGGDGTNGIVNIHGTVTVDSNTATVSGNSGGGIYITQGQLNFKGAATITNNTAAKNGGGIYAVSSSNVTFSNTATITGNKVTEAYGGGIYVSNGNVTMSSTATISSNSAITYGGGIYVTKGDVTIANATLTGNTAQNGGGIYTYGDGTLGNVTITNATFSQNKATSGSGGGLFVHTGDLKITKKATFTGNTASSTGGGIYTTAGNVIITDAELESNTATTSGGGIYATNGDVTITNATLTGNSANSGGGIYTLGNGTLGNVTITNATFNQNKALSGSGGGLYVNTGDLKILTLASFNSNTASTSGGAMYATGGHITIANAEMQTNTATTSGGGIYATGGDVAITNATLTGNSSATGGGIFVNDGNISITSNAVIKSNKATSTAGGGLCATDGDISIANADISSNSAVTSGGGIHLEGGTLTITKGTISSNTAGTYGGGLHAESNTAKNITLAGGGVFTNNVATTCGGGISVSGPITLNTSGSIQSNSAKNGGGIYLTGGATMNFYEGMICNNQATGTSDTAFTTAYNKTASQVYGVGGGVFVEENSKLFFDIGSTTLGLYGNTATMAADDIFANGNGTAVEIPQVETMVLSGFDVPTSRLLWAEDYMTGDTGYANGTKIINNWDELDDKFSYVTRYKVAQSVLALRELAFSASSLTLPREDSEAYPPGPGRYVCLTLGYNNMSIKITKEGLKEGECAIFTYTRSGDVEPMGRIVLTGMGESVPVSKMVVLSEGTWIIAETGWGYTYNVSPMSITRTISASSSDQDKTFTFTNTKRSSVPAHSEMNVLNIMK